VPRSLPRYFDQHSEPIEDRIATGLHKLGLAMKQQAWLSAAEDGLSPTQGQILAALAREGPLTGTELASRLGLTLPTISDSARVLVDKRLVAKHPDPRHPRASLLVLTAAGKARARKARSWPEFLAEAAATLTGPERHGLLAALVKLIGALQEAGQIPTSRMCITCVHFQPNAHAGPRPHHCGFVDAPMAADQLRIDCAEHAEASTSERAAIRQRLTSGG
jgi:DNA-binding MarR family transcriptional regulator